MSSIYNSLYKFFLSWRYRNSNVCLWDISSELIDNLLHYGGQLKKVENICCEVILSRNPPGCRVFLFFVWKEFDLLQACLSLARSEDMSIASRVSVMPVNSIDFSL